MRICLEGFLSPRESRIDLTHDFLDSPEGIMPRQLAEELIQRGPQIGRKVGAQKREVKDGSSLVDNAVPDSVHSLEMPSNICLVSY